MLGDYPAHDLRIFNRGISGNKVFQLAERWQADALELKPTVLSILIGVNDIWHKLNGNYDGTVEKYETDYKALVKRTKDALPEVKLIICEPFVLRCGAVNSSWFPEFDEYRAAARRVAEEAGALFVPIAQPRARLLMALLEPQAPDSFAAWGFFNGHFEQKEYTEAYVTEIFARKMLEEDQALAAEFRRRLAEDAEFSANPEARREFL